MARTSWAIIVLSNFSCKQQSRISVNSRKYILLLEYQISIKRFCVTGNGQFGILESSFCFHSEERHQSKTNVRHPFSFVSIQMYSPLEKSAKMKKGLVSCDINFLITLLFLTHPFVSLRICMCSDLSNKGAFTLSRIRPTYDHGCEKWGIRAHSLLLITYKSFPQAYVRQS